MKANLIYRIVLIYLILINWRTLYLAQFEEYDLNYGSLIGAFLVSFAAFIAIVILFFLKRKLIINSKIFTILYLIVNSSITILMVIIYYQDIFNTTLKH